jgi:hypothetical protein
MRRSSSLACEMVNSLAWYQNNDMDSGRNGQIFCAYGECWDNRLGWWVDEIPEEAM